MHNAFVQDKHSEQEIQQQAGCSSSQTPTEVLSGNTYFTWEFLRKFLM